MHNYYTDYIIENKTVYIKLLLVYYKNSRCATVKTELVNLKKSNPIYFILAHIICRNRK